LRDLLDPRLFSVDRGELHVLLQHSKRWVMKLYQRCVTGVNTLLSLSEFEAMVIDLRATLDDILESEEYMAEMYLTHLVQHGWVWLVIM